MFILSPTCVYERIDKAKEVSQSTLLKKVRRWQNPECPLILTIDPWIHPFSIEKLSRAWHMLPINKT